MKSLDIPIVDSTFTIEAPDPELTRLKQFLRSFRPSITLNPNSIDLRITKDGKKRCLQNEIKTFFSKVFPNPFLLDFEACLNYYFLSHVEDFFVIHAGGIRRNGQVLIVCGESNSGKTTAIQTLLTENTHYISDEIITVNPDDFKIHPFPRPLNKTSEQSDLDPYNSIANKHIAWDSIVDPNAYFHYGYPDSELLSESIIPKQVHFVFLNRNESNNGLEPIPVATGLMKCIEHTLYPDSTKNYLQMIKNLKHRPIKFYTLTYSEIKNWRNELLQLIN